jgi:hypothetical protein
MIRLRSSGVHSALVGAGVGVAGSTRKSCARKYSRHTARTPYVTARAAAACSAVMRAAFSSL